MLPRIGAALAQVIRPLASVQGSGGVLSDPNSEKQKQEFKRDTPPKLETVPDTAAQPETPQNSAVLLPTPTQEPARSSTEAFFQLFTLFQWKEGSISRWLGNRAYALSLRKQRKGSGFKRGTLLDHKAE